MRITRGEAVVTLLLESKASERLLDNDYKSAFDYAQSDSYVSLLLKAQGKQSIPGDGFQIPNRALSSGRKLPVTDTMIESPFPRANLSEKVGSNDSKSIIRNDLKVMGRNRTETKVEFVHVVCACESVC
eukprot:351039-Amorphochlora_amoeboformis.AAC.1